MLIVVMEQSLLSYVHNLVLERRQIRKGRAYAARASVRAD